MDLGGTWHAAVADEALRRAYAAPEFDDGGWEPVPVPGHWRSTPTFADSDGPLLYRHRFTAPVAPEGRRSWLTLDGLFYDGDVWLDGSYVGATEGYFFPHSFEVTEALRDRTEHVLGVEVACGRPSNPTAKRNLTGVFQHGSLLDPAGNPGGIWRPVHLDESGPVRITALRVLCAEATAERAQLAVRAELDAASVGTVLIRIAVRGRSSADSVTRHTLAHGHNRIRLQVAVEAPALWWPHALGDQPLHDVSVEVLVPAGAMPARRPDEAVTAKEIAGHVPSDRRGLATGLRQIRMKDFVATVNGERQFLKGTNLGPTRADLGAATADELERDVRLAKDAGLDLLRLHGHISRPELYAAADRLGLLVWQDLPLEGGYARSIRRQAVRQARLAVDLLGHHPSVAIWCAHDDPAGERALLQVVPTWNKTVLDASISRALERADPTRPVIAHSGVWPGPVVAGTDSHLYLGHERDLPRLLGTLPRLGRFVSEFGAPAVPETTDWMEPDRWPDLDWERLRSRPPTDGDFDEWRRATQAHQATVIRFHIETLRRLKYRPAGGFCQFSFADAQPAVSCAVLDHRRVPKAGYRALVAACAPVIVVADRPAPVYAPGQDISLDVHVVSDLRRPLEGIEVRAAMGSWRAGWRGDVPADGVVRVGRVRTVAPPAPGALTLELTLSGAGVAASNRYGLHVERSAVGGSVL